MVIKIGDGGGPETFSDLLGLRTKSFNMNAETIDITDSESVNHFRELLTGAGVKSVSLSGAGVFKDASVDATLRTDYFVGTLRNFQVIIPDFGTFEGAFQITTLNYAAEHNSEVTFDVAMESSGEPSFTPA